MRRILATTCKSNKGHFEIINNPKYYLTANKVLNRLHKEKNLQKVKRLFILIM